MAEKMQVKSKRMGYYDLKRRPEGAVFMIEPKYFSDKWMEKVEEAAPSVRGSKSKSKPVESEPIDLEVI